MFEVKISQMGLVIPTVPAPIAAYVPAVKVGEFVFTSGQLPMVDGKLLAQGIVGDLAGDIDVETAKKCAAQSGINALAAVKSVIGTLDNVVRIVKVTGFIACRSDFTNHSAIMNGASELFQEIFGDAGVHARSSVGMSALPLGAPTEVELVVQVRA
ncbi:MAG: RidA family protein [Actinobacteria bacterium]|nr:RidA family protein [Actinomycetota bacterium]